MPLRGLWVAVIAATRAQKLLTSGKMIEPYLGDPFQKIQILKWSHKFRNVNVFDLNQGEN